jgi:hypothetical protein
MSQGGGIFSDFKVGNQRNPKEGPKVIPLNLDFAALVTYTIDLTTQQYQTRISMVQTVYVDASGTDSQIEITVRNVNQVIIAKGRTQGYYSILAPAPTILDISSLADAIVPVHLINVPIAGAVWPTT